MKNYFDVKALKEQRGELNTELQDITRNAEAENRVMTQEEITRFDELETQSNELLAKIESAERVNRVKGQVNDTAVRYQAPAINTNSKRISRSDYNNAFKAWAMYGSEIGKRSITDTLKRSADKVECNFAEREFVCRAQSYDVSGEGDDQVNDSVFKGFVEAKAAYGGMLQASNVIEVATAETLHYATDNDTASAAAIKAQNAETTNTSVSVDRVSLTPKTYTTSIFPVSLQLIRDAKTDIAAWISRKLSRRILYKVNTDLTSYNGTNYDGVMVDAASGTTGLVDNLTDADLYDLYFSVDAEYRNGSKCYWMMSDDTLASLMGSLEDTVGRPLWGTGINAAPGESLLGKRIIINNAMDTMTMSVSKKPIIFGDFENYVVHTVGQPKLLRAEERYIEYLAVGFFAYWEVAGKLVDAGTHPIKYLQTGVGSGGW